MEIFNAEQVSQDNYYVGSIIPEFVNYSQILDESVRKITIAKRSNGMFSLTRKFSPFAARWPRCDCCSQLKRQ